MKRRGASLGTVLMISSISLFLMLAVGSVGVFNLHFSTGLDQREHARNLAESAIQRAIAALAENVDYGFNRLDSESLPIAAVDYPGPSLGYISFSKQKATENGVRWSTNNLAGAGQVPGYGGSAVPPQMAQLIGLGECGDIKVQIECLYYRPAFPLGVAGSGKLNLHGVSVLGLAPGVPFPGDWTHVEEKDQRPASIYSNATVPTALTLGPGCFVSGGVASTGGVDISPTAEVRGELRPYSSPQKIPRLDPAVMVGRVASTLGLVPLGPGVLQDYCHNVGDVNLNSDLELEGGVLAVTGNLNVTGTLKGRGTVLVTGDASLGSGSLEAGRNCAVVAGHDLTLHGANKDSFFFQGLVYASHSVKADGVTVVGSLVANDPGSAGNVRLDNVRVVTTPGAVQARLGDPYITNLGNEDSVLVRIYSLPDRDPAHQGQHVFFGRATYRMSPLVNGLPGTNNAGLDIRWTPGHAAWTLLPGDAPRDLQYTTHDDATYDGSRDAILQDLRNLLNSDGTNRPYWTDISGTIGDYMDELEGKTDPTMCIDLNLNKILSAAESGRILRFREL